MNYTTTYLHNLATWQIDSNLLVMLIDAKEIFKFEKN